jgi:hypothetical protein
VEIARIAGRLAAAVLGLIGVVLGLVVNLTYSAFNDGAKLFGATLPATHGVIGFGLLFLAFVGAVIAVFKPRASAALLLIGGAGFFYPVHWFALIASPFILLGALLAFIDKSPSAKAPTKPS